MIGALFLAIPRTSLGISVYEREVVRRKCGTQEARRNRRFARLSPCSAILSNFVSFMESTAISAQAKTAFNAINIICNKNNTNILTFFCNNNILSSKKQKTQPIHGFQCTSRVLTSISEQIDFVIASVRVRTTVACIHFVIPPSFPQYNIFYYRITLWLCQQLFHQQSVSRDFLTVS